MQYKEAISNYAECMEELSWQISYFENSIMYTWTKFEPFCEIVCKITFLPSTQASLSSMC